VLRLTAGREDGPMRTFVVIIVAAFTLVGCSSPTVPTPDPASATPTPTPPNPVPARNASIWAMAIDPSGGCIEGATFEVLSGQGPVGAVIIQETPCSVWDAGGGIWLKDLKPGVTITLRASAVGYTSVEKIVYPKNSGTVNEFLLTALR
jgi:hypothetical protein